MQTHFTLAQLADPDISEADKILRACVHCGFCTATCPTYVLLGDELDSPRGRIYLIKDMLENDRPADGGGGQAYRPLPVLPVLHDHLPLRRELHASGRSRPPPYRADLSRARWHDRLLRRLLGFVLPRPDLFRARAACWRGSRKPFALAAAGTGCKSALGAGARAPAARVAAGPAAGRSRPRARAAAGRPAGRLRAASAGAADQRGDDPAADPARLRGRDRQGRGLLRRADPSSGPGRAAPSRAPISRPGSREIERGRPRRHRHQRLGLRHDGQGLRLHVPRRSRAGGKGANVSALTRDITEFMSEIGLQPPTDRAGPARRLSLRLFAAARPEGARGAERSAGQAGFVGARAAGRPFVLRLGGDLQSSCSRKSPTQLRDRKVANIESSSPEIDRGGQYRLHHADRRGNDASGGPYGRIARLGDRRAQSQRRLEADGQRAPRHDPSPGATDPYTVIGADAVGQAGHCGKLDGERGNPCSARTRDGCLARARFAPVFGSKATCSAFLAMSSATCQPDFQLRPSGVSSGTQRPVATVHRPSIAAPS